MRSLLARHRALALTALLASLTWGCAAPAEDVGESEGAAAEGVTLDTTLSEEEQALLRGEGLVDCIEESGDATLCRHPNGVVVLSADGIAILRADGATITAAALTPDREEKRDVGEVLASVSEPSGDVGTASLRPQGLASAAAKVLVTIAERLGKNAPRWATVAMVGGEAEVAAMRSAALAGDLRAFAASLPKGQLAGYKPSGVTLLGGETQAAAAQATQRWFAVTNRKTIGMAIDIGESTSEQTIETFFRTIVAPAKREMRNGERLTLVVPTGHGSLETILSTAAREQVDVVFIGTSTPPGKVAAIVDASQPLGTRLKAFADRIYSVTDSGILDVTKL